MSEPVGGRTWHGLVGPTASGKSAVAQYIAEQTGAAVLSADSMLVYRGMDIGTAKPLPSRRGRVRYLGMDLVSPSDVFNVWLYRQAVLEQLVRLPPGQEVLVAGGSGLYVKALTGGLDDTAGQPAGRARWEARLAAEGVEGLQAVLRACKPAALERLADARNPRRLIRALERSENEASAPGSATGGRPLDVPVLAGLQVEPALLNARIEQRVAVMYATGLLNEVAGLLAAGDLSPTARQAIGYAEAIAVLSGQCNREEAMVRTATRTRQLAKRQRTWFRHQARVIWVDVREADTVESIAAQVQNIWRTNGSATTI